MNLDAALLEILACPACKSPLAVDDPASELVCTNAECALAYPVRDDIPVLLVDEARKPGGEAAGGSADAGDSASKPDPAGEAPADASDGGSDGGSDADARAGD